ncbi:DUF6448 family protein [Phenylobacterium sp.]|uniref:DUF6448 family protein n=1 Tax=Phenylobacterium sp. TaxID=1871053 RepID=UPI002BEC41D7|nr:DUF6448 family protein [Phenylobacterium sp.]HVI31035.1 DUF6448 family protein [Phenylobacterium sp.]
MTLPKHFRIAGALAGLSLAVLATPAAAHCDAIDGPVAAAAQAALASGDPSPALIWVKPEREAEARAAFTRSLSVRRLGPEARTLADRAFLETLVRLHRQGEGAPYTGLAPAGQDLGPAIPIADAAVASGSQAEVEALLANAVNRGLAARFTALRDHRPRDPADLAGGRAYVERYVSYLHYVEGLHRAASEGVAAPARATAEDH